MISDMISNSEEVKDEWLVEAWLLVSSIEITPELHGERVEWWEEEEKLFAERLRKREKVRGTGNSVGSEYGSEGDEG